MWVFKISASPYLFKSSFHFSCTLLEQMVQFLPMKDRSAKAIGKSFKKAVTMGVNNEINFLLNGKLRLHSCNCIQKRINIQN